MSPHLLFLKYSLAVSSLAPIMHACATNYYQVGMHRFAIRELGVDDAMWPVQKYIPVPETVGEPVFNRHHLQRECKKIMAKYQEAPKLISGNGINLPVDIPLVDDYSFDDPADAVMYPDELNITSLDLFHSIKPGVFSPSILLSTFPMSDFMSNGFESMWPFCEEKNLAVSDLDGGVK